MKQTKSLYGQVENECTQTTREQVAKVCRQLDAVTLGDCGGSDIQNWNELSEPAKDFYFRYADQILSLIKPNSPSGEVAKLYLKIVNVKKLKNGDYHYYFSVSEEYGNYLDEIFIAGQKKVINRIRDMKEDESLEDVLKESEERIRERKVKNEINGRLT